ncbi:MAG: hypothetical protein QY871_00520 [Dehalococcoides mccartyi]|uniref:hypothetical protein n=1 Tax=Dehalococcoides mccartyi TaxID=61435 RepID=UPI0025C7E386|nr:hypothetical protein [Dehalococcoides mccartyi]MDN4185551.1 hypothetical protein [Dehalococcoides mccartyi]
MAGENIKNPAEFNWHLIVPIVMGFASAIGYALAFIYEVSYFDYFKIPVGLIELNWNVILIAIAGSLVALTAIAYCFIILFIARNNEDGPISRRLTFLSVWILFLLGFSLRYLFLDEIWPVLFSIPLLVFYFFIWPLISKCKIDGYRAKLQAEDNRFEWKPNAKQRNIYYGVGIFCVLVLIALTAHFAGRAAAATKTEFWVPEGYDNYIALKVYPDKLICAARVGDNAIKQTYLVLNLSEDIKINTVRTGFLRVAEIP